MNRVRSWVAYLQVAPLALVFLLFLIVPIATIVVVSFFDYNTTQIIPAFLLQNYEELLLSPVTWRTYQQTIQFALITWALTLGIGFTVAMFIAELAFDSPAMREAATMAILAASLTSAILGATLLSRRAA